MVNDGDLVNATADLGVALRDRKWGDAVPLAIDIGLTVEGGRGEEMSPGQASNLARFEKKLPKGAQPTKIYDLPLGGKAFQADVPARNIPGSKAVYEKQVDAAGRTLQYTKTTYDANGNIIHVKPKIEPRN
jgi:hypothetical protein